ncbi:MAG: EVE domain-containing protein [Nitrososphaerales archaeon]
MSKRSKNLKRIKPKDKVVFYLAGKEGGKFAGTATVASSPYEVSQLERELSFGEHLLPLITL